MHDYAFFLKYINIIWVNYPPWIMSSHTFGAKDLNWGQFLTYGNPSVISERFRGPRRSEGFCTVKRLLLKNRHIQRQLKSLHLVLIHRGASASMVESDSIKRKDCHGWIWHICDVYSKLPFDFLEQSSPHKIFELLGRKWGNNKSRCWCPQNYLPSTLNGNSVRQCR